MVRKSATSTRTWPRDRRPAGDRIPGDDRAGKRGAKHIVAPGPGGAGSGSAEGGSRRVELGLGRGEVALGLLRALLRADSGLGQSALALERRARALQSHPGGSEPRLLFADG